ncbi:MAG: VWA domain-containing protein [Gammaproteobacteria bacterium]|nr:VWA domain-containing protein [Gammaproteobacteria bacterium]
MQATTLSSRFYVLLVTCAFTLAACSQAGRENPPEDPAAEKRPRIENPVMVETEEAVTVKMRQPMDTAALADRRIAGQVMPAPMSGLRAPSELLNRENYAHYDDNPVKRAAEHPVSTFSVDVDTGSYANLRRLLDAGQLPPQDAVRIEELLNYFDYDYAPSSESTQPFATHVALSRAPWDTRKGLLRIALKGYEVAASERLPANLVFLVDVSGSMQSPDKLELLKKGLGMLAAELDADDRVSLVVYAGASGVVLHPTPGSEGATIRNALAQLTAGGSTNGAAGIRLAYDMARQAFIKDGINRVILATDGDFNVGTVNFEQLVDMIERERDSGITLTTLGFGGGNYNDHLMEQLADKGNGNYAYIDSIREANRVLVTQMTSTLQVIAKDVKAQVEFNPAVVAEYRLIGYENRMLDREDFSNDKVDAGDIGAGHSVTALYEIVYVDSNAQRIEPLRYGREASRAGDSGELGYLKLRYKLPDEDTSRLLEQAISQEAEIELAETDDDFRFATAVAAFGQQLRGGQYSGDFNYDDIRSLAATARGSDASGQRGEFLGLVQLAATLDGNRQARR